MTFRRGLKITLWSGLAVIAALLVAAGGLVTWVVVSPRSAWNFTEKHFLPEDLQITWDDLHGDWHKRAWNRWSFELAVKNLAVKKQSPQVDVGVETIALQFDWNFLSAAPVLEFDVLQVRARAGSSVHLAARHDEPGRQSPYQQIETYLASYEDGLIEEIRRSKGHERANANAYLEIAAGLRRARGEIALSDTLRRRGKVAGAQAS